MLAAIEDAEPRNPLLKSLVWMLVGIGLVGLVLFGAQKYLFNRNAEPAPAAAAETQPPNAQAADNSASKPSPVGQCTRFSGDDDATKPAPRPTSAARSDRSREPRSLDASSGAQPMTNPRPGGNANRRRSAPRFLRPSTAPKPGVEQSVQFLTEPPGAQVIIDGNSSVACKTPCMLPLSAGRHALTVQLAGYRPYPRVFNVPQDSDIFLQLTKASGTLSITSEPPGATIELDGALQTKRTPAVFILAPGTYHIKVARSGASIDFDVQLRDGEFVNKRVDF